MVDFFTYLDIIECPLLIIRYANQNNNWMCWFGEEVFLKLDNGNNSYVYGIGATPDQSIKDYVNQIKGKILVIKPFDLTRREIKVPEKLTYNETIDTSS